MVEGQDFATSGGDLDMDLPSFLVTGLYFFYAFSVAEAVRRFAARWWYYDAEIPYLANEFAGCLQGLRLQFLSQLLHDL